MYRKMYKLKYNASKEQIEKMGFVYDSRRSDDEHNVYMYKFPVYKYLDQILLESWFTLCLETGLITIDVMDIYYSRYSKYAPYYLNEYGDYTPVLEKINKKIQKEMRKMGIVEVKKYEKD